MMRILMSLTVLAFVGCSTSSARICDGSEGVTFGARVSGGGTVPAGQQVMVENGFSFLYVDGHCQYQVETGDLWSEARTAVLTSAQEDALIRELHYSGWATTKGAWSANASDASSLELFSKTANVSCTYDCPSAPAAVHSARDAYPTVLENLWKAGSPLDGGVRLTVVAIAPETASAYEGVSFQRWPLPTELKTLAKSEAEATSLPPGSGDLIVEGADVLRKLRSDFREGPTRSYGEILVLDAADAGYKVSLRDDLELEDSRGLIVRP